MPVIEADSVCKVYDSLTVVDSLSIEVHKGECWGLLGPNGAGKTTFLRMLVGRTPPTRGRLRVLDLEVPEQARVMRERLGLVPQTDTLDPEFSVLENLRVYASYFGFRGPPLEARLQSLVEFAALQAKRDAPINTLSGGMKRRLSLARALINEPELLVLDEPTTGLDPQARQLLWQRLRELKNRGMTLVLTTHYMDEAERLCDRISIMDHGRLLTTAPPRELIAGNIEAEVVEVHGPGLAEWHESTGARLAERHERVGETGFYYANDERALLETMRHRSDLTFMHRPANLEDVFVKLTGRELRDE
ncbi:MAG: ATP-binding cassette domain-containing protein [Gammaproteobacteria bacterium]